MIKSTKTQLEAITEGQLILQLTLHILKNMTKESIKTNMIYGSGFVIHELDINLRI